MRVAAVDIGTNTALLLIAERGPEGLRPLHEEAEVVRLGEGVDRSRRLSPAAVERTLTVLARYGETLRRNAVDRVAAIGTQALREVENSDEFLARAAALLGCPIEVVTGEREAKLSWQAAASAFPLPAQGRRTVVDIGGGSTEILVGGREVEALASLPIGAVRLTERHLPGDPPTLDQRAALTAAIDLALAGAPAASGEIIGIAGTVTTLCALHLGLADYDPRRVHGHRLHRDEVRAIVDRLGQLTVAERRLLPGLDPRRADVIYAGGAILARLLERAGAEGVVVSDRGIRWGLAEAIAQGV